MKYDIVWVVNSFVKTDWRKYEREIEIIRAAELYRRISDGTNNEYPEVEKRFLGLSSDQVKDVANNTCILMYKAVAAFFDDLAKNPSEDNDLRESFKLHEVTGEIANIVEGAKDLYIRKNTEK